MPQPPNSSSVPSFNFGTPVTLFLAFGRAATFTTDRLLKEVGLGPVATAPQRYLLAMLPKGLLSFLASANKAEETGGDLHILCISRLSDEYLE